jgi:hypothetical protein
MVAVIACKRLETGFVHDSDGLLKGDRKTKPHQPGPRFRGTFDGPPRPDTAGEAQGECLIGSDFGGFSSCVIIESGEQIIAGLKFPVFLMARMPQLYLSSAKVDYGHIHSVLTRLWGLVGRFVVADAAHLG